MPTVRSARAEIYYEARGDGPAIVFAHGAGGNAASWWQQVPYFLERGQRVIAFDHRGFGRSRCPDGAFDLACFPGDLLAILDAEGIERAALVCQSMGGWTGLPAALRHPDRVRALVLCGTPGGMWTPAVERSFAGIPQRLEGTAGLVGPGGAALAADFAKREPQHAFLYEQISSFNSGPDPALLQQIDSVRITAEDLSDHRVPTLVVAGRHDVLFPPDALRDVAAHIPGAELVELEGSGHSTYFEEPERFNAVLADFLDRNP